MGRYEIALGTEPAKKVPRRPKPKKVKPKRRGGLTVDEFQEYVAREQGRPLSGQTIRIHSPGGTVVALPISQIHVAGQPDYNGGQSLIISSDAEGWARNVTRVIQEVDRARNRLERASDYDKAVRPYLRRRGRRGRVGLRDKR